MPAQVDKTYETKVIPLLSVFDSRYYDGVADSLALNFIPEVVKTVDGTDLHMIKRDGAPQVCASVGTDPARGLFYWADYDRYYVSVLKDIYIYDSNFSLLSHLVNVFTTTANKVGFTSFLYQDDSVKVVATDGTDIVTIDYLHTVSTSAGAQGAPTIIGTWIPTPLYIDGMILLAKASSGDCYSSDINDPLTWHSPNFITSEISPDRVLNIAKINNYFIMVGSNSIEYFYDAGNPTGTPFARNDTFVKHTGLLGDTIAQFGNQLFMVGKVTNSMANVFLLEDFKLTPIATPAVRRWLQLGGNSSTRGFILSHSGHDFYVLVSSGVGCLYYDIQEKLWGKFSWKASTSTFNITNALGDTGSFSEGSVFTVSGGNALYQFNSDYSQDGGTSFTNGTNFSCISRTDPINFGTNNQKTMSSIVIWADRKSVSGVATIDVSDDDYVTWPLTRDITLQHERPNAQQWGRFRNRSFRLTFTQNSPLRVLGLECDINIGVT